MVACTTKPIIRKNTVVVTMAEDLGSSNCATLQTEFDGLQDGLRTGKIGNIVIDCSATKTMGCAAIGLLLRLWTTTQQHGCCFSMCSLSPLSSEMLRIMKLNRLWPIHSSLAEAIAVVEFRPDCASSRSA